MDPYILGSAFGAAVIIALISFFIAGVLKRLVSVGLAVVLGFCIAGAIVTGLAAYGMADGAQPNWNRSAFAYGVPSALAAFCALFLRNRLDREEQGMSWARGIVVLALAVGALLGARLSMVDEVYADEELLLSDPLTVGLRAVRDEYPALWEHLSSDLRAAEMSSKSLFPVASDFYQRHQAEFYRHASDKAVVHMSMTIQDKLEYLSKVAPELCVELALGRPSARIPEVLPYEYKLSEAKALEVLIRSAGQGNSGIAPLHEAETEVVGAWEHLAGMYPDDFYAATNAASGEDHNSEAACKGFVALQGFLLERPESTFARMSRSKLNFDPQVQLSADAQNQMALASLHAEAALLSESTPEQLDAVTTLVGGAYKNGRFTYAYELRSTDISVDSLEENFEQSSLASFCDSLDVNWAIELGVIFEFEYTFLNGSSHSILVDSARCNAAN